MISFMGVQPRLCHAKWVIQLTSLAGQPISINPDLIRMIESAPDTIICFVDGMRLPIKESQKEVQQKILDFKREVARQLWTSHP